MNNPVQNIAPFLVHCPKGEGEGQICGQGQNIFDILLQPLLYVPSMTIGTKLRFLPPPSRPSYCTTFWTWLRSADAVPAGPRDRSWLGGLGIALRVSFVDLSIFRCSAIIDRVVCHSARFPPAQQNRADRSTSQ